jgi:hypothetical protein
MSVSPIEAKLSQSGPWFSLVDANQAYALRMHDMLIIRLPAHRNVKPAPAIIRAALDLGQ